MRTFGLIGYPLSHSFSKKYFTEKFITENIEDCRYELFAIEKAVDVLDVIEKNPSLCGLNVTIPHKLNIIPFLTETDEAALNIGAVNCISITQSEIGNILKGYNTD